MDRQLQDFSIRCIAFAFMGLISGLTVDYSMYNIQKNNNLTPLTILTLQLLTTTIVFYMINHYVSSKFMDEVQGSITGLFFIVMYFNSQINFFNNIRKLLYNGSYEHIDKKIEATKEKIIGTK